MIFSILNASTWTSAGETRIQNFIAEFRGEENPELEALISQGSTDEGIKRNKQLDDNIDRVGEFDAGNVGEIQSMSSAGFGNVRSLANDPFGFFVGILKGKAVKFFAGAFFIALAFEIFNFIMNQFTKPGRSLDPRFRRVLQEEFLIFTSRKEKQELVSATREVRVTTLQGLRGGRGKVSGNLFVHGSLNLLNPNPNPPMYAPNPKTQGLPNTFRRWFIR